jgi:hypothetical protein
MHHFGEPLVNTVFDFGFNGKPPANPQVLDWLASKLMDSGWRMKPIHRLLVTSTTYRLQSWGREQEKANRRVDPDNRYTWRTNPRRMEAETVRDSVLHVAGQLNLKLGGPELDHHDGQSTRRRSLYYRHAYEKQMTFLKLFDAASAEECYRRAESISPQQALALANSPIVVTQSRILARRLQHRIGQHRIGSKVEPEAAELFKEMFVRAAFEQVLGRLPTPEEERHCASFLETQAGRLADTQNLNLFTAGASSAVKPASDPQERALENLVQVLLNHNDFVTIR